jgi:hypothetical protein
MCYFVIFYYKSVVSDSFASGLVVCEVVPALLRS